MRLLLWPLLWLTCAAPAVAQDEAGALSLRERLRNLGTPPPVVTDPYAGEKAADLARIAAEHPLLFAAEAPFLGLEEAPIAIVLFTRGDCMACDVARGRGGVDDAPQAAGQCL